MYKYAVFQGGGVKGMALVGALAVAEQQGISFSAVGGTSAGAIVAGLYAAGYSASEMRLAMGQDFASLLDGSGFAAWALYRRLGMYRGRKFHAWIHDLLKRKGVTLFKDCKIMLRVVASDVTARRVLIFDRESYPDMEVSQAIRMSMSIPLFFEPVRLGEHLIVDGGLLSNFPTSLFGSSETIGFRLRTNSDAVKLAPEGVHGLLPAMLGTMLDGRDNYDVESKRLAGLIEIDPGQVSTTQFALSHEQKEDLYKRGLSAANQFFADEENRKRAKQLTVVGNADRLTIIIPGTSSVGLQDQTEIRFSISGLIRIESEGKLMLVKGARIEQYQPVGGVFKVFRAATTELKKLGMKPDNKLPIDFDSEGDLRVLLPWRSSSRFLDWYLEGRGRETTPWREFYEELIEPNFLPAQHFMTTAFEHVGRKVEGVHFSEHFQCYEILIAEIFSLSPTARQEVELSRIKAEESRPEVIWASPDLIRSRGFDIASQKQVHVISETSCWILEGATDLL